MEEHYMDGLRLLEEGQQRPVDHEGTMFYGPLEFFDGRPFHLDNFRKEQSYLLERVRLALASMEEDIGEMERGHELLSSTFQINVWRKLIKELEESIECSDDPERLERCILQCALTFYRELFDPRRSTMQLDYLLRLKPAEPEHWASYGLCLIEMTEQGLHSDFDLEARSAHCFFRAARLSIAHLLARDSWYQKLGSQEVIRMSREYYYNASEAYPNIVARRGMLLLMMLAGEKELLTGESIRTINPSYEGEDLSLEINAILGLNL